MKCELCGLEMMIYRVERKDGGARETVYVCRNPKCSRFDRRLKREQDSK